MAVFWHGSKSEFCGGSKSLTKSFLRELRRRRSHAGAGNLQVFLICAKTLICDRNIWSVLKKNCADLCDQAICTSWRLLRRTAVGSSLLSRRFIITVSISGSFDFLPPHSHRLNRLFFIQLFIDFSQTGEKTALYCLTQHDWKLDIALDNYFANPEVKYLTESKP